MMRTPDIHVLELGMNALEAGAAFVRITLDCTLGGETALAIEDDGRGMDGERLEHCFESGFTTKNEPGAGHGLAQLYADAQGRVTIKSTPGRGCRITARLADTRDACAYAEGLAASLCTLHAHTPLAYLLLTLRTPRGCATVGVRPGGASCTAQTLARLHDRLKRELTGIDCIITSDGGSL